MAKIVREVRKQIKGLQLGDLIRVRWFDACKGEARIDDQSDEAKVQFDVPVTSWGVFLGLVGEKTKHVLLIRDHFQMNATSGVYDIDFNVVPIGMIHATEVLKRSELEPEIAQLLQQAFLKARTNKRKGRIILHLNQEVENH
jgi:hypothetical protein